MPAPGLTAKLSKRVGIRGVPTWRAALRKGAAAGAEHARVLRQLSPHEERGRAIQADFLFRNDGWHG